MLAQLFVAAACCTCWLAAAASSTCHKAGVFVAENIKDDEYGHYLSGTVRALFQEGCEFVEVLLQSSNSCKSKLCLEPIYTGPKLNLAKLEFRFVDYAADEMVLRPAGVNESLVKGETYDHFVSFGNDKLPLVMGIGKEKNTFVCPLFPYDLDRLVKDTAVRALGSYDSVVVSSRYSYRWFTKFIEPYLLRLRSLGAMAPSIRTVVAPIPPLPRPKDVPHFSAHNNTVHIVFYGDFYDRKGENSAENHYKTGNEGHMMALQQLARLVQDFPTIHMHMSMLGWRDGPDPVNNPSTPETDTYIGELQQFAAKKKLPVDFVFEPDYAKLVELVSPALTLWHMGSSGGMAAAASMTGLGHGTDHSAGAGAGAGISSGTATVALGAVLVAPVVQAMSTASCIPIVARRGVGAEVVHNGKQGYLASTPDDYYAHTVDIMHASHTELDSVRYAAFARAAHFHPDKFTLHMQAVFKEATHTALLRKFAGDSLATLREKNLVVAPSESSSLMMVVIAVDFSPTLEFVVLNALLHLNAGKGDEPKWQAKLYLTSENLPYYQRVLDDVEHLQFSLVPLHLEDEELAASVLMKSDSFWSQISNTVKKVLILGHDSVITHHVIEPYMQYDFIGAPFMMTPPKRGPLLYYEGAFSLRSVDVMKKMHLESSEKVQKWIKDSVKNAMIGENILTLDVLRFLEWEQKAEPGTVFKFPTAQVARDFAVHRIDQYEAMKVEDAHSTPFCLDNPWVYRDGDGVSRGDKVPAWTESQADKIEHYLEHSLAGN